MNVSLYLPDALVADLRSLAESDGRSLSNLAAQVLRQWVGMQGRSPVRQIVERSAGRLRQVDLEELVGPAAAIARAVEAGPRPRRRQRSPRKGR